MNIFAIICIYIYINNPILVMTNGIGTIKILYPIAIMYLIYYHRSSIYLFTVFKTETILFILLLIFTIFRTAFGGNELYIRSMTTAAFENVIITAFLAIFLMKNKGDNWLNSIILVGIVGALISVACLTNPSINIYIKELQVLNDFSTEATFRSFGLADGLTFSYGISQGIILSILILNSQNKLKYLLFSPLLIVSSLFNARTGILIVGVILIYEIFANRRIKFFAIIGGVFLTVVTFSDFLILSVDNEDATKWVSGFFLEIGDSLTGSKNADYNTAEVLFEDMVVLPSDTLEWIFGSGQSSFLSSDKNTDIGFFLQLKYGGLIFVILLYSIVFYMFFKTYKDKKNRWFSVLLFVSFILANIKGDFIPSSGGFRLLFLLYVILTLTGRLNSKIQFKNC